MVALGGYDVRMALERDRLADLLDDLRGEQRSIAREAAVLEHRGAALSKTIEGIESLLEEVDVEHTTGVRSVPGQRASAADHPKGVEAVRRILVETGAEMDVRTLADELVKRGWIKSRDPVNATFSNASRAVADEASGIVRRRGPGNSFLYRYVSDRLGLSDSIEVELVRAESPLPASKHEEVVPLEAREPSE